MIASGNGIPSQEDFENLATTGEILKKYKLYEEYWKDTGNTVSVEEKEGVKKKFDEARLVRDTFKVDIYKQLVIRKEKRAAVRKNRSGPGGGSGGLGASGEEPAGESGVGESGGGDSALSLVQKTLQSLTPEKRRRCEEALLKFVLKESEGSAKGGSPSRGARGSARGGKSCVEEGDAGGQKEEHRVLNLFEACKDLYVWPIAAQELAEVAQLSMPYCLLRACVALE